MGRAEAAGGICGAPLANPPAKKLPPGSCLRGDCRRGRFRVGGVSWNRLLGGGGVPEGVAEEAAIDSSESQVADLLSTFLRDGAAASCVADIRPTTLCKRR